MTSRWYTIGLSLFALVSLAGCAENKLTRENYDLIMQGKSTQLEVEKTLGDDHLIRRGREWEYDDRDRHLTVYINFDERGLVSRKQWVDASTDEWDDTQKGPEGEKIHEETRSLSHDK
ncbi:MAG: hypothetical protein ACE5E1_11080 [Phycisphaerae bacterium]